MLPYSNLSKKQHLEMFVIYYALFKKTDFTVTELNALFKNDKEVAQWKKNHKSDLSTALHAFLSSQFVNDSTTPNITVQYPFITRKKNKDNIWTYSVDLKNEDIFALIVEKVNFFLNQLEIATFIEEESNTIREWLFPGQYGVFIDAEKQFNLLEWYESATGHIFESSIVYV